MALWSLEQLWEEKGSKPAKSLKMEPRPERSRSEVRVTSKARRTWLYPDKAELT